MKLFLADLYNYTNMIHGGILGLIAPFLSNNLVIILTAIYYNRNILIIILETILFIIFRCYKFDITNSNYKLFSETTSIHTRLSPYNDKIGFIVSYKFRYIGYISYINNSNADAYSGFVYSSYCSSNAIQDYIDSFIKKDNKYLIYNTSAISDDNKNNLCRISQPIKQFNISELKHQKKVVDYIFREYSKTNNNTYCVVLYGNPGIGKSLTAYLLANKFVEYINVNLITGYSFNHPKTGFRELYNMILLMFGNIRNYKILNIILLDEIDIAITRIHNDTISQNTEICPDSNNNKFAIKNKEDYNSTMDAISIGIYPNVILIMTTNKSRGYFDDMDPSYFRYGRINAHINYNTMKCLEKTKMMRKTCEYDNIE